MVAEHYIKMVDPRKHVESAIHVILADNTRNNVHSNQILNVMRIKDLHLPKASTIGDIVDDFGLTMSFDQLNQFETVGDLVIYVEEKMKEPPDD